MEGEEFLYNLDINEPHGVELGLDFQIDGPILAYPLHFQQIATTKNSGITKPFTTKHGLPSTRLCVSVETDNTNLTRETSSGWSSVTPFTRGSRDAERGRRWRGPVGWVGWVTTWGRRSRPVPAFSACPVKSATSTRRVSSHVAVPRLGGMPHVGPKAATNRFPRGTSSTWPMSEARLFIITHLPL